MQRPRTIDEVHAELADEHRQIIGLVGRIEDAPADADLPRLLKTLHDMLVDHFAHEQFPGGLYECMGATDPRYHDELKVLVREHCEVLSTARALVERSRAGAVPVGGDGALDDQVARLIAMLREHEVREHRLAQTIRQAAVGAR